MATPEEKYKERLEEMQAKLRDLQGLLGSLAELQFRTSQNLLEVAETTTRLVQNRLQEIKQTEIINKDLTLIKMRLIEALRD